MVTVGGISLMAGVDSIWPIILIILGGIGIVVGISVAAEIIKL